MFLKCNEKKKIFLKNSKQEEKWGQNYLSNIKACY